MKVTVVSGFSPEGYELYGKKFIETFHRFWPHTTGLIVYHEDPIEMPRGKCICRWLPYGIRTFIEQNKNIPERCGMAPMPNWRKKDYTAGYSYRHDAVKFCWQMFYPEHAAQFLDNGDILVWLDGDVITTSEASTSFIEKELQNADLCYLGRPTHSELGFWAVKLGKETRRFLSSLAETYRSGAVFNMEQWHSAYVFDRCVEKFEGRKNNLTPSDTGNVWLKTPLAAFSTHLKGRLKAEYNVYGVPGGSTGGDGTVPATDARELSPVH